MSYYHNFHQEQFSITELDFLAQLRLNSKTMAYQLVVRCKVCGRVLLVGAKDMKNLVNEFYSNNWDTWKEEVRCPACVAKQGWPALIADWKRQYETASVENASRSAKNSSRTSKTRKAKVVSPKPRKRSAKRPRSTSARKASPKK
jgi:hypothetical protein